MPTILLTKKTPCKVWYAARQWTTTRRGWEPGDTMGMFRRQWWAVALAVRWRLMPEGGHPGHFPSPTRSRYIPGGCRFRPHPRLDSTSWGRCAHAGSWEPHGQRGGHPTTCIPLISSSQTPRLRQRELPSGQFDWEAESHFPKMHQRSGNPLPLMPN